MVSFLLALVVLVILLQAGVMAMLRKLLQQLEIQRERIAALEQRVDATPAPPPPPSSATFHLHAAVPPKAVADAAPRADAATRIEPAPVAVRAAAEPRPAPAPARADAAERLRGEMLELMHQLVDQGMSVREIAARCGLSEAEAELMLRLRDGPA
jgi:AcrR family transcriptional regulator